MENEKIDTFLQEVTYGPGQLSMENAKLLWQVLFDEEISLEETNSLAKAENRSGNKIITDQEKFKERYLEEDDFILEYDILYDEKNLLLIVDEEGILRIGRKPKRADNPYYGEHGDYAYKHVIPSRLLKLIVSRNGKLRDNLDLLRSLPSEIREPLSNIDIVDFQKIAIEVFRRPLIRKYYYIIFSKGEKTIIERTYTDDKPWELINMICNRNTKSFTHDIASGKLTDIEGFQVIITNEKYLLSRYRFCMTYVEFKHVFQEVLSTEAFSYLEKVWQGEFTRAYQSNGNTSVFDESEGTTYYCDPYLTWQVE